ncbi:MAG: DUF3579 domain-containing protein [Sideroxydans sp.]
MLSGVAEFVVQGVTLDGKVFQPPGWAEQLCKSLGTTGPDGLLPYPSYVHPVMIDGVESVVVRVSLQLADEKAFEEVKRFVTDNRLLVRAGRGSRDAEAAEPHLVTGHERRSPQNNNW